MARLEVHKFGGTSVGAADRMFQAAARVTDVLARPARVVVVTSAMGGVTRELVAACDAAAAGDEAGALERVARIEQRHLEAHAQLAPGSSAEDLRALVADLAALLRAARLLGELTLRSRDRVLATGEKLAARLVAEALRQAGHPAVAVDADGFLDTDAAFGGAAPLGGVADRHVQAALGPVLAAEQVPVVTGYCGRAPDGATTTLGRGGSDLTATLLAAALGADEVTIWTDVDGVFSADPRAVPEARVIRQLNYREAAEMSYYGAKVLHPRTMIPVTQARIPVVTRNSFRPEAPGTVVDARFTPGSHPVKAITAVAGQALVSVEGKGMAGVPGVAARVFGALASADLSVTAISQSSSESSICFGLPEADAGRAEQLLKRALARQMARGHIEEIAVRRRCGLVAAVGLGMAQTPGVAARALTALAAASINVLAIAQGSSELNLTLAVDEAVLPRALRAMHRAFGLDREDTGDPTERRLDLLLLGCGQVGQALVRLIHEDRAAAFRRLGLQPRVVAVADRSGFVVAPRGLSGDDWRARIEAKRQGTPLALQPAGISGSPADMVREAFRWRLSRPILVDVSDATTAHEAFAAALEHGADVATANKRPLAGEAYGPLRAAADDHGRWLRAEATVGAGLPVVDTLELLVRTGDVLAEAEGSLSGTLGYLMTELEAGVPLSAAVEAAAAAGYTEPDAAQDLCGADVARKAVILARLAGWEPGEVQREGLVPDDWAGQPPGELLARLRAEVDASWAERVRAAAERGQVVRYAARVTPAGVTVGPRAVSRESALGRLHGTDNLVLFRSERYADRPLVVVGPGAGVHVTAMGVLGDVLRIAATRTGGP